MEIKENQKSCTYNIMTSIMYLSLACLYYSTAPAPKLNTLQLFCNNIHPQNPQISSIHHLVFI